MIASPGAGVICLKFLIICLDEAIEVPESNLKLLHHLFICFVNRTQLAIGISAVW